MASSQAVDELGRFGAGRARSTYQCPRVSQDGVADRHLSRRLPQTQQIVPPNDRQNRFDLARGHVPRHRPFLLVTEVSQSDRKEETIKLRRGQWSALLRFKRTLRDQDEERHGERMGLAADGNVAIFHGVEQHSLELRRGLINVGGDDQVREQRAGLKQVLAAASFRMLADRFLARDFRRRQVGCELNTAEPQLEGLGKTAQHQTLAEARTALDDHMSANDQPDEHMLDGRVLANHRLAELVADLPINPSALLDRRRETRR